MVHSVNVLEPMVWSNFDASWFLVLLMGPSVMILFSCSGCWSLTQCLTHAAVGWFSSSTHQFEATQRRLKKSTNQTVKQTRKQLLKIWTSVSLNRLTQTPAMNTRKISFWKKVDTWSNIRPREILVRARVISTAWTGSDIRETGTGSEGQGGWNEQKREQKDSNVKDIFVVQLLHCLHQLVNIKRLELNLPWGSGIIGFRAITVKKNLPSPGRGCSDDGPLKWCFH